MKKHWIFGSILLSAGLIFGGCSNNEGASTQNKQEEKKLSPEEQIKKDAKEVKYNDLVSNSIKKGTLISVEGNVTYADNVFDEKTNVPKGSTFTLAKQDGEDVYWVKNKSDIDFKLDSKLRVYGKYNGLEDTTGIPQINSEVIEVIDDNINKESKEELAKKEALFKQTGEINDPEVGHWKTVGVGYNDEVGIDGADTPLKPIKMGSMNLYISEFHVVDLKPAGDFKSIYFNDQEKVRAVIATMKAENTTDTDVTFHPNQAIIVTDTGEQIEPEMGLMGEVGGDFLGKVTKEGQVWWILKNLDKDIKNVKLIISPPTDMDFNDLSEEKRLEFNILSWQEARKKDQGK